MMRGPAMLVVGATMMLGCPKEGGKDTDEPASTGTASTSGSGTGTGSTGSPVTDGTSGPAMPGYCPGESEVSPPCLGDADCPQDGSWYCSPTPDDCPGAGCGTNCESDMDCAEGGGVCEFQKTGCCAGMSGDCVPACTADSCAEGDECLPSGHCAPTACGDGYLCAEGWLCMPGEPGADGHGCVLIPCDQAGATACSATYECVDGACQRIPCATAADCPCGNCIKGQCWERPWVCTQPAA